MHGGALGCQAENMNPRMGPAAIGERVPFSSWVPDTFLKSQPILPSVGTQRRPHPPGVAYPAWVPPALRKASQHASAPPGMF
jgi:hypothetical protein